MTPPLPIGSIFAKPVDRPIEGVIKADDAEHLAVEIEEYVLTNETAQALSDLLEAYTAPIYGGSNGVWISGFFGSGKSHLLKMLAHLLGDVPDQSYPRQEVVAQFKAKAETASDQMLVGSLSRIGSIPATSLLFNIDVKAPLIDKSQKDALLQVFLKVFNEARGYYGGDPAIARLERHLDRRGVLDTFKASFVRGTGVQWELAREEPLWEQAIAAAVAEATGEPQSESIVARYEEQLNQYSIEDFADEVAEWLAGQSAGHRLLFMVDEVGQFIGTDTKLMLNLQSIVEQLNTKCKGRAWVCATSQEDMDSVIGDQSKQQGNDFSKIQARFATRMKLTSRDVEEVIEKRLLSKDSAGTAALADLYDAQETNFRTLFEFVDGAKKYRNYSSPEHFIGVYPFIPYQFDFFSDALRGLSDHNVFEGRHTSVGERSMLGVVQNVTKTLVAEPVGCLVPFDMMFLGISRSVKSASIRNISVAERQLESRPERDIAIRLLKALFLVKYVKGFNATPRNLAVLLYDRFEVNPDALAKQITAALDLLEQQTYIQRNGSVYEYLTDEEQDIEKEIKSTDIDSVEISKLLSNIISGDVTRASSFRHQATGRDFKYELRLDDASYSRAQPLAVHYISPALGQSREVVMAQSMGRDEVRIILANDPKLYSDLRLHVQTEKYLRVKGGTQLTETQNHILESKRRLNSDRRRELIARVKDAISHSELVINGADITVAATDPETRVFEAVGQLINRLYTQLSLLGGISYNEQNIVRFVTEEPALIDQGSDRLQPAADEVNSFIARQRKLGANVTVKRIVENFEDKPYGWPLPAIQCALARLFVTSQITFTIDGHLLKRTEIAEALRNGAKHPNIVVSEQKQFDTAIVQQVRSFAQEFFDSGDFPNDALDLAAKVKSLLTAKQRELQTTRTAYAQRYPFVVVLDEPIQLLGEVTNHADEWYLDDFTSHINDLLEAKEDAIDPLLSFLAGSQKTIYDDAAELVAANKDNLDYLPRAKVEAVRSLLDDPKTFRGAGITKLKEAAASLQASASAVASEEKDQAAHDINERWAIVQDGSAYQDATDEARATATHVVERALQSIAASTSVPVIRQLADEFEEHGYNSILGTLEMSRSQGHGEESPSPVTPIVPIRQLPQPKARLLETDADADIYVEELRAILHNTIAEGKRVSL